jgi:hypothetical protein
LPFAGKCSFTHQARSNQIKVNQTKSNQNIFSHANPTQILLPYQYRWIIVNSPLTLDGYLFIWTDVLTPYGVEELPDAPLAVFGALSFWWLGEHGSPRMDTSEHMWFLNDQLAVRFIEEIDFDFAARDATAVLLTAPTGPA